MRWILSPQKSADIMEQILLNRGVARKDWARFLSPDFEKDLGNPFKLMGMREATKILLQARKDKDKIGIFSDYDADGIPAAALLHQALGRLGIETETYIPNREQGYGLNKEGIESLIDRGCRVLLAVDLGITNKKEIEYAKQRKIQSIVIDHHLVQSDKLPKADAIINPKQKRCPYADKDLSAGGLAYKLIQALAKQTGEITIRQLKWWLDLPAISTITDIVPLTGENRTIAKYGLIVLQKTKNIGLQALYRQAGICPEKINTYTVGFQIGPRINAPGRLLKPRDAWELLVTQNRTRANILAKKLNQINLARRQEMDRALKKAIKRIEKDGLEKNKILLIADKDLKPGVVGLVADRLMDRYHRPAIVLCQDGKIVKGSARSIGDFHIMEALDICGRHLSSHGGHARAAGLSLELKHLHNFYDQILRLADEKLTRQQLIPKLEIDAELRLKELNLTLYRKISQLEPFGFGNPKPVFVARGVQVDSVRTVGQQNQHLKLYLKDGQKVISGIGFGLGERAGKIDRKDMVEIAFSIDLNQYQGRENLELKILDFKLI
jgi:single-stranded-DNA-specific exonuclease